MNRYELTIITNQDGQTENFTSVIADLGGRVEDVKEIGNRRLAYPIKKQHSGIYISYIFTIEPSKILELNKKLFGNSLVLRHLIITKKAVKTEYISKPPEELAKPTKETKSKESKKEAPEGLEIKEEKPKKETKKKEEKPEEKKEKTKEEIVEVKEEIKEIKEEIKETKEEIKEVRKEKNTQKAQKTEEKGEEEDRLKKLNEKLDELLKD